MRKKVDRAVIESMAVPSRSMRYSSVSLSGSTFASKVSVTEPSAGDVALSGHEAPNRFGPSSFGAAPARANRTSPCCGRPLTLRNSPPYTT